MEIIDSRYHNCKFSLTDVVADNSFVGGPMALWPIFRVVRSSHTDQSMLVARALKIGQIADGGMPPTYETML